RSIQARVSASSGCVRSTPSACAANVPSIERTVGVAIMVGSSLARWPGSYYPHSTSRAIRASLLLLVLAAIGSAGRPVDADSRAEPEPVMAVTVVPRSESGAFRDTTVVYLDGRIDAGAPSRLAQALEGIDG